eukprot:gnl/TRDRNA2_/TRDRNA2_159707_c0_seq1.p1 gnl/TRDRNA2_/TRDRNA2_159707_c0~~gnl/TRDRNA2_/TRDRNA2_159707_c0_seq1.p1  ORF type:complete len:197 (+),score=23.93 gnl/TRDRNA2_/TRDRNA2_159707_c0_seq1:69-659(+)
MSVASPQQLAALQGRWQHSLRDFGCFSVYGDLALFDRGISLRITCGKDGLLRAGQGWRLSQPLSDQRPGEIVWTKEPEADDAVDCSLSSMSLGGFATLVYNQGAAFGFAFLRMQRASCMTASHEVPKAAGKAIQNVSRSSQCRHRRQPWTLMRLVAPKSLDGSSSTVAASRSAGPAESSLLAPWWTASMSSELLSK